MHINLIIFPLFILLGLVLSINDTKRNRKIYIVFCILVLMLEGCLRDLSIGADTKSYYNMYNSITFTSWNSIWDSFIDRYVKGNSDWDFGYTIMQKLMSYVTNDFRVFTFFAQLIFFVPLGLLLYRYSTKMRQLIFAFVIYVSFMHIIALTGARQLYAMGLGILAFMFFNERKYLKTAICLIIGLTIHMSSLIILLALGFSLLKPRPLKIIHTVSLLLVPLVFLFPNQLIILMGNLVGMEKYSNYGTGGIQGGATTFILLLEFLSLFCLFGLSKKTLEDNDLVRKLYAMIPCFTVLGPLIISNGAMIRVSMYFHLYLMLLVPFAFEYLFRKNCKIAYFAATAILLILSLRGGGFVYYFFWQNVLPY